MADVATQTGPGGERLQNQAVDFDQLAQDNGFPDFATMQAEAPQLAQQLINQYGGGPGSTIYNQAAIHDDLNKKKMWGVIGGTVLGGALGDYFAAGAGGAGAGASGGGASASGGAAAGTGAGAAEASPYVLGAGAPAATAAAATPSLGVAGTVGLPAGVGTVARLGQPPPPPPPKTGTSLTSKIFSALGLGADYLASRQSQNATNAATQQLIQAGQQAKADLAKVYGGVTPVLSQVVQRQQQNLAPYTSLGSGAASLLGYGLGIPGVQAAPSGVYAPPADPFGTNNQIIAGGTPPPAGSVLKSSFQQGDSPFQPAGPGQTGGTPFPTSLPSAQTTPGAALSQTQALPVSSLSPQTQTQSSYMVTMRAPTGETEQVPAAQVGWYTSRGAVVA